MSYRIVILWYERRICLERIGYIGVDWRIEALQLPAARHIDVLPIVYIIGCLEEIGQGKTRILHQFEFPYTIQRAAALILGVFNWKRRASSIFNCAKAPFSLVKGK